MALRWSSTSSRTLLRTLHLYLALSLGTAIVLISLTGSLLVWRDHLDRIANPIRYAVSGSEISQPVETYLRNALAGSDKGQRLAEIVYPTSQGWPIKVYTRGVTPDGHPMGGKVIHLDPVTALVLDRFGVSETFLGKVHNLHHMLSIPQFSGRQIVGWFGIALTVLTFSGLYLWWPRMRVIQRSLQWRRFPSDVKNFHYLVGFWASIPLAVVTLSGVYLSFPNTAFMLTSKITELSGPQSRGYGAIPTASTSMTPAKVIEAINIHFPGQSIVALKFPTSDHRQKSASETAGVDWQVRVMSPSRDVADYRVDDRTGAIEAVKGKTVGDRSVELIKSIHEGHSGGFFWAFAAFICGILPAGFFVSGVIMWWRGNAVRV